MKHARLFLACMLWLSMATMATAQTELSGSEVGNGTYYLKNVGTGLYLKFGGAGNAKAAEGHAGTAITLAQSGKGYTIQTKEEWYLDGNLNMTGEATEWIFENVDKDHNLYRVYSNTGYVLASQSNAYGLLGLQVSVYPAIKQEWVLLTAEQLKNVFDATPEIQAAAFDKNDNINAWNLPNNAKVTGTNESSDAAEYYLKVTDAATFTQTISNTKSGSYNILFDAKVIKKTSGDSNPSITIKTNKTANYTIQATNEEWNRYTVNFANNNGGAYTITITNVDGVELYLDNFQLQYVGGQNQGSDVIEQEQKDLFKGIVLAEIEAIRTYIKQYYIDGLDNFEAAIENLENNLKDGKLVINTESEYKEILAQINTIKEKAKQAHRDENKGSSEYNPILNPGFESGDKSGWTAPGGTIISTEEFTAVSGANGNYLYLGNSIEQDVTLANGKYKLTAKVASTNSATVTLTANEGKLTPQSTTLQTSTTMTEIALDKVIVYDGKLLLHVSGSDEFYADDFVLTYQEALPADPQLKDTDMGVNAAIDFYPTITVARTLKAETWSTFVVPFDMAIPDGWEVKTLTESKLNKDNITLIFSNASSIEAGVPYMVRVDEARATSTITGTNVWLDTELKPTSTEHVEFTGVYTNGNVPAGAFFISSNTFYRAADNSNTMKAFRAYIKIKDSVPQSARSLSYRTDGETTAIDNSQLANDNEATVVAIYNLQGVRLDDMQEGVNILQMSDGSVVKVIIK